MVSILSFFFFFFFNDTATTEIYTLSLHDALPISYQFSCCCPRWVGAQQHRQDRKSTRLNSSHVSISYAVFCLKKKKKILKFNRDNVKKIRKQLGKNLIECG